MENIILASSSPRRQEILKALGIPFQVVLPNIDESSYMVKNAAELPEVLAKAKVQAVARAMPPKQVIPWILGADTLVVMGNKIYGKPKDPDEAIEFLGALQNKAHHVITALALYNGRTHSMSVRSASTKVTFAPMTKEEIEWYVDTGDWHGAAGGYRIQGMASCFISKIEGTNSCVVGLPIFELYDMLKEQGYSIIG